MRLLAGTLTLAALHAATTPAAAADDSPDYLGTWLIAEARPAPWVQPNDPATAPHDAGLVGKTITFRRSAISAPALLACRKPSYEIRHVGPEYLFQGGLTEPAAQAAAIGFPGQHIPTLLTGCEGWFEYHFSDAHTAMFALDNMVYTIHRRDRRR